MKFATGFIASCVGLVAVGCGSSSVKSDSGTSGSPTEFSSPGTGGGSAVMTSGTPGVSTSTVPWSRPTVNPNPSCAGRRIGVYSWDASYWRGDNPELLNFLDSDMGREFACGSTFINIADYSSPDLIPDPEKLVQFAKDFNSRVGNNEAVLFFTYGDVTSKDGNAMVTFTETFFRWASSISAADAAAMGRIGVSYDVEHIGPDFTKQVLLMGQDLRKSTPFGDDLVLQYTVEGDKNVLGTDYAFKYADSVLVMLYSNYITSPVLPADKNMFSQLKWLLTEQCPRCLDDAYATTNYKAQITVLVEASCQMGRSCSWASFCAYDAPEQGAHYLADVLDTAEGMLLSSGVVNSEQYSRLFNLQSPYAVHNWEWYRCYAPFNQQFSYSNCGRYHSLASACRNN